MYPESKGGLINGLVRIIRKPREGLNPDFSMKIVSLEPEKRGDVVSAFLYVAIGVPNEFYERNNDEVDAMYAVDDLGFDVLRAGFENALKPVWAWANYNFSKQEFKIPDIYRSGNVYYTFLMSSFEKLEKDTALVT